MHTRCALMSLSLLALWASACGDDDGSDPRTPELRVFNQSPPAPDVVSIDGIFAESAGFVAIVQSVDGAPTLPAIGVRAVSAGQTSSLAVSLERSVVDGEQLYAQLHIDADSDGSFDWNMQDTSDEIVRSGDTLLRSAFTVTSTLTPFPVVVVDDQPVAMSTHAPDQVTLKSVVSSDAGFVYIRNPARLSWPSNYGSAAVQAGLNPLVEVTLTSTVAPQPGQNLEAVLCEDRNGNGTFEVEIDLPVVIDGGRVIDEFSVLEPTN